MLPVLISLIAESAQLSIAANQTGVNNPSDIFSPTSVAGRSFMRGVQSLPFFQVLEYNTHGMAEFSSAHGATHCNSIIFFVTDPDFETLGMHTFLAGRAA